MCDCISVEETFALFVVEPHFVQCGFEALFWLRQEEVCLVSHHHQFSCASVLHLQRLGQLSVLCGTNFLDGLRREDFVQFILLVFAVHNKQGNAFQSLIIAGLQVHFRHHFLALFVDAIDVHDVHQVLPLHVDIVPRFRFVVAIYFLEEVLRY